MRQIKQAQSFHLKNLEIYDGTGSTPTSGDILICNGEISAIGQVRSSLIPVDCVKFDCHGLSASPGFIDLHSHIDGGILIHPEAECFVKQGITTSVGGNCGGSAGGTSFWTEENRDKYRALGIEWSDLKGFLSAIERVKPTVNIAMLFGHGDVRIEILGKSGRSLTPSEKQKMLDLSHKNMKSGAFGVSTGLEYVPGRFADIDELLAISKAVKKRNGIHSMHMRNEGPALIESVQEAIEVAKKSGVRFEISHLKAVGETNWGKLPKVLQMLDQANSENVDISADVYPYLASHTELAIVLPNWVLKQGKEAGITLLKSTSDLRQKIAVQSHHRTLKQGGWDKIVVITVVNPKDKWMEGLNIKEIALKCGKLPQEQALDILISNSMRVTIIRHSMSEADLIAAMKHPKICFVTDGNLNIEAEGNTHPRAIGTYPRVLGYYVREKGILSMEEAIRKSTSLPAAKLGIDRRGILRRGFAADVLIFDPQTIADNSTYQIPWRSPTGIFGVFINGRPAVWQGKPTGIRQGSVLKKI